jgi:hypothetical protein
VRKVVHGTPIGRWTATKSSVPAAVVCNDWTSALRKYYPIVEGIIVMMEMDKDDTVME